MSPYYVTDIYLLIFYCLLFLFKYLFFYISDIVEGVRRCNRTPEVGLNAGSGGGNGGILSANVAGNTSGNGSGASSTLCAPHIASGSSGSSPRGVLRPLIDKDSADEEIINMMTRCWSEDPYDRPDFSALKVAIRKLNK